MRKSPIWNIWFWSHSNFWVFEVLYLHIWPNYGYLKIVRVVISQIKHFFAIGRGFEGLCLETQYGDPLPAELIEQFNIFDMSIEQEDGESALSSHAKRETSIMMRERRKSDFNRMSLRKRSSMSNVHAPIRELNEL